jgi:putative ABC transport system ATP-binding protein
VHSPALLLADEPTGNLDPASAGIALRLLATQVREHGAAMLMVTHSEHAAAIADRRLRLGVDGLRPA